MSLASVKMSEDVWLTCLTHALSTETEEIMGLLLGDIENSVNGSVTALIWGASPQTRSDRRKDRVETNPEQLAAASAQAEISFIMTLSTGRTTRVIGWYHSHPHITVLPSHVDVRTQAMYQLLDSGFIGLIFSCFSEDINKVGRIQVIAFQSSDGKQHHMSRPISLSPIHKSPVIEVESSLSTSENVPARSTLTRAGSPEQDTADSRTSGTIKGGGRSSDLGLLFANADASHLGRVGGNYQTDTSSNIIGDIDPMDMSESMQEAMHRSNLDMSGAEYVRKEVPLHVLPTSSLVKLDSPLMSFTELQRVLYEEEQAAYNQAILQNMSLSPAISALQCRLRENETRLAVLTDEVKNLEPEMHRTSESNSGSPRPVSSPVLRGSAPLGHRDLFHPTESVSARSLAGSGSRSRKECGFAKYSYAKTDCALYATKCMELLASYKAGDAITISESDPSDLKDQKMSRPGDWNCRSCHHLNFQRRDSCQRCGDAKSGVDFGGFGGRGGGSSFGFMTTGSDVRPGDWYCAAGNCGAHNFASRSSCFKCGAFKDDSAISGGGGFDSDLPRSRGFGLGLGGGGGGGGAGGGRPGWKSGDWICTST
ncbi:hypothetical protein DVH24_031340 [Malus domestica]|uniref:MPN domain-containing protein n=1 Tax=Malus domestica TaxID=3750 RepID=A0A498HHZ9_MALDO|nr:hypothetical protein DVH24_031340 [Malus domestica]